MKKLDLKALTRLANWELDEEYIRNVIDEFDQNNPPPSRRRWRDDRDEIKTYRDKGSGRKGKGQTD